MRRVVCERKESPAILEPLLCANDLEVMWYLRRFCDAILETLLQAAMISPDEEVAEVPEAEFDWV